MSRERSNVRSVSESKRRRADEERKTETIKAKVSPKEHRTFRAAVAMSGLDASKYIRLAVRNLMSTERELRESMSAVFPGARGRQISKTTPGDVSSYILRSLLTELNFVLVFDNFEQFFNEVSRAE
jgi:hypothetical protein